MTNGNTIKFQGKTYNLDDIKAGIQKKDLESSGNNILLSIFNLFDKKNEQGLKNNTLDISETEEFIQGLISAAGDDKLSKSEAKKYLSFLGLKDVQIDDLIQFLDVILSKSNEIKETTYNKKHNSIIIEYKEGYYDEILQDGTHKIKAKESIDTSLKKNLDIDVSYTYMGDVLKNRQLQEKLYDSINNAVIENIIKKNNLDKNNMKVEYSKEYPNLKGKEIYYDADGNESIVIIYTTKKVKSLKEAFKDENEEAIYEMVYKDGDKWTMINYYPKYGDKAISTMNFDRTKILNEMIYYEDQVMSLKTYSENSNNYQMTEYSPITGKMREIIDLNEKGQKIKIQYLDDNEQIEHSEIWDYYPNGGISKIKTFDKNGKIQTIEIIDTNGDSKYYDSEGNEIQNDSVSGREHDASIYEKEYKFREDIKNNLFANETQELLKQKIDFYKQNVDNYINTIKDGNKEAVKQRIIQYLDNCLKSNNPDEILKTLDMFKSKDAYYIRNLFLYDVYDSKFTEEIDEVSYQGRIGDCWLLSSTHSISETPDGGKEYIKSLFDKDENGNIIVKLLGGKQIYTVTSEDMKNNVEFSLGPKALRAIETACDKYVKEFKPEGNDNLNGNWERFAFYMFSGNEPIKAIRENGILGVKINNEFVPINKDNAEKIKHIPIDIEDLTKDDLLIFSQMKNRMAMTCSSIDSKMSAHAFYVKNINKNSIQVKEPNSTGTIATYPTDGFLEIYAYDTKTIFIL